MLNVYDLMLLKESVNNEKIIYIQFNKNEYVFRTITPKEYTQVKNLTSTNEELSDSICQVALIYPNDFNFSESNVAGLSDSMCINIIEESMLFDDIKVIDKFEESKDKLNSFLVQCTLFIKAAFPEYSLIEIEEWGYEKLMDMTAKAEFVLKIRGSDYKIEYNRDDLNNESSDTRISDKELIQNGIDPMLYNSNEIQLRKPLIDYPVILGNSWDREELIKDVRQQILRR